MKRFRRALAVCILVALAGGGSAAVGDTPTAVTIYTSLPFDELNRQQTDDILRGEQLALEQAAGQGGACTVALRVRDDSTPATQGWDPQATAENARAAAQDPTTVAYIGEFSSAASTISIPITNEAGIVQVSPSNTALELTKSLGRASGDAPDQYYPTGTRTYARVAPSDHIQGGAQGEWMKALRVKRLFVADDSESYGVGVAKMTAASARRNGIRVVGTTHIDILAANYRGLAKRIRRLRADAFFFGGITANNAVRLYRDVFAANRRITLFGPDGVADTAFTNHIPRAAQKRMHITVSTIDPADYPGQQFFTDFKAKYGRDPEPYAIYGYEALSLVLDAMNRAGAACADRAAVRAQVFATHDRQSVLGKYSIDKDGDITTSRFGRFVIRGGRLAYAGTTFVKRDGYGHLLDR